MEAGTAGVTIVSGECVATLALRGGGPSRLTWQDREILEGYAGPGQPDTAPLSANVVLAPWPNRTRDGLYEFDGQRRQLQVTEPAKATALHGFVAERGWTVAEKGEDFVRLVVDPGPQQGWPWPVHLSVQYTVTGESGAPGAPGLSAHATLRNDGDSDMPAALGFHLYPSALGAATDACTLSVPPHRVLPLDERGLPDGPLQADTSVLPDAVNPLAGLVLDHCLRLDDTAQDARFVLRGGAGEAVALTTSPELRWAQVFTPDASTGMPYPGRPGGRAVAVEPMTAPPDALNSGTGLARLPPGESLTCSWRLAVLTPEMAPRPDAPLHLDQPA
ncbi:aldose epimerase family protein [Corynebacterium sp. AOP40-9SA-29]|uniref:aldose epimerase family protein n=1 Tax=Corynebacterium sp. AOP40-9SA-29 TaxID=3457677 RepID=UPI004033D948